MKPTALALAISHIYGTAIHQAPVTALRWARCEDCAKYMGKRLSACKVCDGSGRIAVLHA